MSIKIKLPLSKKNNMKSFQIFVLTFIISCGFVKAQFTVNYNNQPVKAGEAYPLILDDISKNVMDVAFKNPAKIPEYTSGRATLSVLVSGVGQYTYEVNGYTAVTNFLYPKTKTPISYILWAASNQKMDFERQNGYGLARFVEYYANDVNYRKLLVRVELKYEEWIDYDKYGKAQILLDPFEFYIDVWEKSGKISMPEIGATYNYPGSGDFKSLILAKDDELEGFTDNIFYQVNLGDALKGCITTCATNANIDDELNNLKTEFEDYLVYGANKCNGKKILKTIKESVPTRKWDKFTDYNKIHILAALDRVNNKEGYMNVKIWQDVTIGKLTGIKFSGVVTESYCTETSFIIASSIEPADPKKQKYKGVNLFYFFKHPTISNKLIAFYFKSYDAGYSDPTKLDAVANKFESFLANLSF